MNFPSDSNLSWKRLRRAIYLVVSAKFRLFAHSLITSIGIMFFSSRSAKSISDTNIARICVIRLDRIGDLILTSPFLRELRRKHPNAVIDIVVRPDAKEFMSLNPAIDNVLVHQTSSDTDIGSFKAAIRAVKFGIHVLRPRNYDIAYHPRFDTDRVYAALLTSSARIPIRIAFSEMVTKEKARLNKHFDRFFTRVVAISETIHEAVISLLLLDVTPFGPEDSPLSFNLGPDDLKQAVSLLKDAGIDSNSPFVVFGIGAADTRKVWPADRYAQLATRLSAQGYCIVLVGGNADTTAANKICEKSEGIVVDLTGRTTLGTTAAMISRARLFVGNDSGPMHLAAAVGVPIVALFCHPITGVISHANSPERFGPWTTKPSIVLRPSAQAPICTSYCHSLDAHCILGIEVDTAFQAVINLLDLTNNQ